jgi:hypothetical protein
VTLPGVPWYIYNDHADGYYRCKDATASTLVLDLAVNQSSGGIFLGGADIPLASTSTPGESATTEKQPVSLEPEWKDLNGAKGWHHSPNNIDYFMGYASRVRDPAEYFRTVKLQAQYAVQGTEGGGYELRVNVKSIIGAGVRDLKTEDGRDQVAEGKGSFGLVLERTDEEKGGWVVSAVEGLDGMRSLPA